MDRNLIWGFILLITVTFGRGLELRNGAYEDFVIKVSETVPAADCKAILQNLETTLASASQYLFAALNSRAYLRSTTVLLPPTWPDSCTEQKIISGSGERSDLTVEMQDPSRGRIFTQQSLTCAQPGDQIHLSYEALKSNDATLGRSLVKEFAMYRYGVFEEQGYLHDPIYPICFADDNSNGSRITGCSDLPIQDNGICSNGAGVYNTTQMVDDVARTSIMFAAEAPQVSMFCDEGNHDRFAPTKHNSMCDRRSVLDVILAHSDFEPRNEAPTPTNSNLINTTPNIVYKKQNLTRFVFVLENTKDMMQRESWSYLRRAMRHWTLNILPDNTEVGMVLAEESSRKASNLVAVNKKNNDDRDKFYSSIPYTPSESIQPGCIHCAIKEANEMLITRTKSHGPANNIIVVIAAGVDRSEQLDKVLLQVHKNHIRIATINYPTILRSSLLNFLADESDGVAYTVFEQKLNTDTTLLTTYFELKNILFDLTARFYSGLESDLSMEIYRREFVDDGHPSITGSFELDSSMGRPSQFSFFTYNTETPLIKSLKLISPSHQVFSVRSDRFIESKMIVLIANISEPGTWTWTVEPYAGSPHPHFLQVTATPRSYIAPVIRAKFWTHRNDKNGPLILLSQVKRGQVPVIDATVEVIVSKLELNGTSRQVGSFQLLDSGSGDPDVTKGDGVYTRYFSPTDAGLYNFEVIVTDNGNAYASSLGAKSQEPCCGSNVPKNEAQQIPRFQRVLPKITLKVTDDEIAQEKPSGRIGDLKSEVLAEELRARLAWSAPDMAGNPVNRYEIRYANTIQDITQNYETIAVPWDDASPFILPVGAETTVTLDLASRRRLLDKPLYFAVKAFGRNDNFGSISNWARIFIRSPTPPPTIAPNHENDRSYWPNLGQDNEGEAGPKVAKTMGLGLELILPIVIGFILLVVLLVLYCYFCVVKRRDARDSHKKSSDSINKNDKATITIVPGTPQNFVCGGAHYASDLPDPHQVGVPIQYEYEEETKKRYSLVNQQEQQLIEELKQQQQMHHGTPNQGYVSVISNGTMSRGGPTLSPFNSWSASQLLHEHERRHSPMENMDEPNGQELLLNQEYQHVPPPVPPLPAFNGGYPVNYSIYGVHGAPNQQIYQSMQRNEQMFNASLQGSLSSVNSGDKKRRNVTMV